METFWIRNLQVQILIISRSKSIDPLLFLVIPRYPKTCSQNIATYKPFPSNSTLSFYFYHLWLSFLAQGYLPY